MITQVSDELELFQIGGPEKYKHYFSRIRAFIKVSPTRDASTIARETHVPLVAVRRALREGVFEQSANNKVLLNDPEFLKQQEILLIKVAAMRKEQRAKASEEEKSRLVSDLSIRRRMCTY